MIQLRRVVGASMNPTLGNGQIIVVSDLKTPRTGDIVVAVLGGREVVKRIKTIHDDWQVELIGDNLQESTDSRSLGTVPMRHVLGVVVWYKKQGQSRFFRRK